MEDDGFSVDDLNMFTEDFSRDLREIVKGDEFLQDLLKPEHGITERTVDNATAFHHGQVEH